MYPPLHLQFPFARSVKNVHALPVHFYAPAQI